MPASLYPNPASLSLGSNLDLIMMENYENMDSRSAAEQIALQLALLQQQDPSSSNTPSNHTQSNGHTLQNGHIPHNGHENLLNGHGASGSLEDLKNTQRRSQNMTECVPVPSSEHVAEIVGRQGMGLI